MLTKIQTLAFHNVLHFLPTVSGSEVSQTASMMTFAHSQHRSPTSWMQSLE